MTCALHEDQYSTFLIISRSVLLITRNFSDKICRWNQNAHFIFRGRDSSVGIATGYELDGPGIESRWGRDSSRTSRPALGPTQPPIQWVPGLSRRLSGRGVVLTTHPLLAPRSRKSRALPLPPSGPSGLLRGDLYLYLLCSVTFFFKLCLFLNNVEKYRRAGQARN
jgi:hypothetical protein